MSKNWIDAIRCYQKNTQRTNPANNQANGFGASNFHYPPEEVQAAIDQLENFLASPEGGLALQLLAVSGRHIIFGESYKGSGYGSVYFIDGSGLHRSSEAMGTWVAYAKEVPKPLISSISAKEVIFAAIDPRNGCKKPLEILGWLRGELDKIAEQAR